MLAAAKKKATKSSKLKRTQDISPFAATVLKLNSTKQTAPFQATRHSVQNLSTTDRSTPKEEDFADFQQASNRISGTQRQITIIFSTIRSATVQTEHGIPSQTHRSF